MTRALRRQVLESVGSVDAGWLATALATCGPGLRATCRAWSDDGSEADDLLQETLLRALLHPPADRDSPLLPWLRTVARRAAIDRRRARRTGVEVTDALPDPRPADDPGAAQAVSDALVQAIATLGTGHLAVFLLRALLGLEVDEVAAVVGVSAENVRVITHRARGAAKLGGGAPERTVAEFLDLVTRHGMGSLVDLVRHLGSDTDGLGEVGAVLTGRAAAEAWTRVVVAAGSVARRGSPQALWAAAAALEGEGRLDEAREAYGRALRASRAEGMDSLASRALLGLARGSLLRGETARFDALLPAEVVPDTADARTLRSMVASRRWRAGDYAEAKAVYEGLLAEVSAEHDRAAILHNLALVEAYAGQLGSARERALQALAMHEAAGQSALAARTHNALGMVAQNLGALEEAEAHFEASLARAAEVAERAAPTTNLGLVALERGDLDLAVTRFEGARGHAARCGSARSEAIALANLGVALHARGRLAAARAAFAASEQIPGDFRALRVFVAAHAASVVALDRPDDAARTLDDLAVDTFVAKDPHLPEVVAALRAWAGWCAHRDAAALDVALPAGGAVTVRLAVELVRRRVLTVAAQR